MLGPRGRWNVTSARVRARIAATHLLLDQAEPAQAYEAGLEVSEAGTVTEARARLGAGISLEEHLRSLPALQRLANFDHMRNALGAWADRASHLVACHMADPGSGHSRAGAPPAGPADLLGAARATQH